MRHSAMLPLLLLVLIAALSFALGRATSRPAMVLVVEAGVRGPAAGARGAPATARRPAGPPGAPFSLDDLGRGLLGLARDPAGAAQLSAAHGDAIRGLAARRAELAGLEARHDALVARQAALGVAALSALGPAQLRSLRDGAGGGADDGDWTRLQDALRGEER